MPSRWFVTIALLAVACDRVIAQKQAMLVSDGRPSAVVVVATDPPADRRAAAAQESAVKVLVEHVLQMSGARLKVVKDEDLGQVTVRDGELIVPPGKTLGGAHYFVLVGSSKLTDLLGIKMDGLGSGGHVIKTVGNALVLAGCTNAPDKAGTLYAVVDFLEMLGCRYLWPGELGKVVPRTPTVAIGPLDRRYRPPIQQRGLRFLHRYRDWKGGLQKLGFTESEWGRLYDEARATTSSSRWADWHRLNGRPLGLIGGHNGAGLGHDGWEKYGKTHPEWFALQPDGTRNQPAGRWRICPSNPELIDHVANAIIEQVRRKPVASVSLSPNDGGKASFCACEECKKLDPSNAPRIRHRLVNGGQEYPSLTDRFVHYWNAIAQRVSKVHPDLLYVVDAYSAYITPPVRERPHPNLVLRYVPNDIDGMKGWRRTGMRHFLWRPNNLHTGYHHGTLVALFARRMAATMSSMADGSVLGVDMQGVYDYWATMGMNYYTAARLSYNPSLKYDDILADYCRSGFGAAAEPVRQYFLKIEPMAGKSVRNGKSNYYWERYTPDAMAELGTLLDEADSKAADPIVKRRIAFLLAGYDYSAITAKACRMAQDAADGEPVDLAAAGELMDRRWLLMRKLFRDWPLAVNVVVTAGSEGWTKHLKWQGPSQKARDQAAR